MYIVQIIHFVVHHFGIKLHTASKAYESWRNEAELLKLELVAVSNNSEALLLKMPAGETVRYNRL